MGKNQGFLSVNLSKARGYSTWAVSWLAELTVTPPSPLPPLPPSPCVRPKNLRVWIQDVPVCTDTTPACFDTCGRGAGTHGDVLNLHTEVFFLRATPHTKHHHTPPHGDRDRETETERDREKQRERETRKV